jgi:hypothetical protein
LICKWRERANERNRLARIAVTARCEITQRPQSIDRLLRSDCGGTRNSAKMRARVRRIDQPFCDWKSKVIAQRRGRGWSSRYRFFVAVTTRNLRRRNRRHDREDHERAERRA